MSRPVPFLLVAGLLVVAACSGTADEARSPDTVGAVAVAVGTEAPDDSTGPDPGASTEQVTDDGTPRTVDLHVQGTFWSNEPSGCNRDSYVLQMTAVIEIDRGDIIGAGDGQLSILDLSRCPDTEYGGQRTTEQPTVQILGTVDDDGWTLSFDFADEVEAFLIDGTVYGTGPMLDALAQHSTATNADGSMLSVFIPDAVLDAGDPVYFTAQTPHDRGVWIDGAFGLAFGADANSESFVAGLGDVAAGLAAAVNGRDS